MGRYAADEMERVMGHPFLMQSPNFEGSSGLNLLQSFVDLRVYGWRAQKIQAGLIPQIHVSRATTHVR